MATAELIAARRMDRLAVRERIAAPGVRTVIAVAAVVWLLTGVGALLGVLAPGLAPGGRPHPVLHGSLEDALGILATNLRLLGVPFALVLLGFHRGRRARVFGNFLVAALIAVNAIHVGLAIGRYGGRLAPYLPQLPLEWLALALSASAWLAATQHPPAKPRVVAVYGAAVLVLALGAAGCETLLTPHAASGRRALRIGGESTVVHSPPGRSWASVVDCLHPFCAGRTLAARSHAPFPSPYGLGSARPFWTGAIGRRQPHDPQGGTR